MTTLDPRPRPQPWVALIVLVGGALLFLARCAAADAREPSPDCSPGGRTALDHAARASDDPPMLRHQLVAAALLLLACREDSSTPTTGAEALEVGEPCEPADDEPCKYGLTCTAANGCGMGFCLELCEPAVGCEPVDGVKAVCGPWTSDGPNVCHFPCLQGDQCPTSYAVDLECRAFPQACIPKESECS